MKTKRSVEQSAKYARKRVVNLCEQIKARLVNFDLLDEPTQARMLEECRERVAELGQRFHEFNAYFNTLTTP